eukprot:4938427-Pyramimonas_sp.AAC.1
MSVMPVQGNKAARKRAARDADPGVLAKRAAWAAAHPVLPALPAPAVAATTQPVLPSTSGGALVGTSGGAPSAPGGRGAPPPPGVPVLSSTNGRAPLPPGGGRAPLPPRVAKSAREADANAPVVHFGFLVGTDEFSNKKKEMMGK